MGYFDIKNFGFCGIGHQDYTARCARAGLNNTEGIVDILDSNDYLRLQKRNYRSAIPDTERYVYNTPETIKYKMAKMKEYRIYVPYQKEPEVVEGNKKTHLFEKRQKKVGD